MKKILFSLLMLCCVTAAWAQDDGFVNVASASQMYNVLSGNAHAKVRLTADIYLSDLGADFEDTFCSTFYGFLDGDGHAIKGDHYPDNTTQRRNRTYLFTYSDGATFKNITFKHINKSSEDHSNQAIITSQAKNNCVFENITFENCGAWSKYNNVGAAAGYAYNSTFTNIKVMNSDFTVDDNYVGSLVGDADKCTFTDIEITNCKTYADDDCAGGVVGHSVNCTFKNVVIQNCGFATGESNVGGIAGNSTSSTYKDIIIDGVLVKASDGSNGGGVVGQSNGTASNPSSFENVQISRCQIKVMDDCAGGVSGYSQKTTYENCTVDTYTGIYADTNMWEALFSLAGGIVGKSENGDLLRNCIYRGIVGGPYKRVGGLVGSIESGSIESCLNVGMVLSVSESGFDEVYGQYKAQSLSKNNVTYGGQTYSVQQLSNPSRVIQGQGELGGIAGYCSSGIILDCSNLGMFYSQEKTGTWQCGVGGIAGGASGSKIYQCSNLGTNPCVARTGGIVGYSYKGSDERTLTYIQDCFNLRDCNLDEEHSSGAILAEGQTGSCSIERCVNATDYRITGSTNARALAGNSGYNYRLKSNRWMSSDYDIEVSEAAMSSGLVAYWLNNTPDNRGLSPVWRQKLGEDAFPCIDPSREVVTRDDLSWRTIQDYGQLKQYAELVNSGQLPIEEQLAVLTADIEMTEDWTPIGTDTYRYCGFFDGQGHTIRGLSMSVSGSGDKGAGLFGVVGIHADISNVIIGEDSQITSSLDTGAAGIVGLVKSSDKPWGQVQIRNCGNHAAVTAPNQAGGILGRIKDDYTDGSRIKVYVTNCYNMGTITATQGNSALLCGYMKDHGVVRNCWSGGKLLHSQNDGTPFSKVNPTSESEFFVGYDDRLDIQNCYAMGVGTYVQNLGTLSKQSGVERLLASALESGWLTYSLNGSNDTNRSLTWQQDLCSNSIPVFGSQGVYHTREVSNEIGTVCLPYALASNDDVWYYAFTGATTDGGEISLNFEYVESLAPGQPALFRVANTGDITFRDAAGNDWENAPIYPENAEWMLYGTMTQKEYTTETSTSSETIYYVKDGAIHNAQKVTIAPYRAFFSGPNINDLKNSPSGARVRVVIDGEENEAAALQLVTDDSLSTREGRGEAYTLFGTMAGQNYRGMVIRGGKMMMTASPSSNPR